MFGVHPCYWYPCDKIIGEHAAAQMPRIRRCFGCGAKGHRKERCPTRAGAEIRKLRKLVRTQQAISKPGREIRPRRIQRYSNMQPKSTQKRERRYVPNLVEPLESLQKRRWLCVWKKPCEASRHLGMCYLLWDFAENLWRVCPAGPRSWRHHARLRGVAMV